MILLRVERRPLNTDHQSYLPGSQITMTHADVYHAGLRPPQSAAYSIAEPIEIGRMADLVVAVSQGSRSRKDVSMEI
jgi:hypothetical protein